VTSIGCFEQLQKITQGQGTIENAWQIPSIAGASFIARKACKRPGGGTKKSLSKFFVVIQ
jgi:hypothetical protein